MFSGLSRRLFSTLQPLPRMVKLVEVGPRDGLQNEPTLIPTATKIDFINRLSATGLRTIEATGFVSPKWIPQLADSSHVFRGIQKDPNITYPVLVPNLHGFQQALAAGAKDIAIFTTPSEAFSVKNTNCSVKESIERITGIIAAAKSHGIRVRGYVSCALGCPEEGAMLPQRVRDLAGKLFELGCYEISLGDTIGIGTPEGTRQLLHFVAQKVPLANVAVHFHNTHGRALINIRAALTAGVNIIDSSVAGLGGCPYAKNASGNVATEDVLDLLNSLEIETGVNAKAIADVGQFIRANIPALAAPSTPRVNL